MRNKSQSKNGKYFSSYKKEKMASESKKLVNKDPVVFVALDEESIGVHLPYIIKSEQPKIFIKNNGGVWDKNWKMWRIRKGVDFAAIRSELPRLLPTMDFEDIPWFIDRACSPMPEKLKLIQTGQVIVYDPLDKRISPLDNPLYKKLYQFQKASLELAIRNFGRLMIADEMGVGKTIQSLACAVTYQKDWPLLIICPSALKHVWEEEVLKWLGDKIKKQNITIVEKSGVNLDFSVLKVAIFSYEIATKSVNILQKFNIVIVDQAHYLKNTAAQRTQTLVPFLTSRRRVILLSGTPALAKPYQVFNLIQIIRPDIYCSRRQFGERYCVLQYSKWTHKLQYQGCRNLAQLHYILKNKIMIRRLKSQVLHQLPQKQRQIIQIQSSKGEVKQIKQLMNGTGIPLDVLNNKQKLSKLGADSDNGQSSPMSKCFLLTGIAKLQGVKNYLNALFQNDVKILIFAHHQIVMDELDQHLKKQNIQHIRIDGSTSNQNRKKYINAFQQQNNKRAALLSITAAGVGITLTAASTVVFAQLHWTPANLIQAEDRAHRIGQKSCVNVHYLIGENTIDHILLEQLQKKLQTTGDILNGAKQTLKAESLQRGSIGKWEKSNFQAPKKELQPQQRCIKSYLKKQQKKSEKSETNSDIDEDDAHDEELQAMILQKEKEISEKNRLKALTGSVQKRQQPNK